MKSDTLIILGLRTVPRSIKQMDEILEALYEMYDKNVPEDMDKLTFNFNKKNKKTSFVYFKNLDN